MCVCVGDDLAKNCEAFGPGLFGAEAGRSASFSIVSNDSRGQPMSTGGLPFTASLENDDFMYFFGVTDNRDGTYEGQYITSAPGEFNLHIMLNDEHHVYGSPFTVVVSILIPIYIYIYSFIFIQCNYIRYSHQSPPLPTVLLMVQL